MSSEQPTGDFPQPIQPPNPSHWDNAIMSSIDRVAFTPLPHVTPYPEAQEVVPSVNPGPDWGSIANGLPVDVPKPYAYTVWTMLNHSQYSGTDVMTEGTYIEGMGTLVRTVATLRETVSISTSFLPGVKLADGKLVPFNYEC